MTQRRPFSKQASGPSHGLNQKDHGGHTFSCSTRIPQLETRWSARREPPRTEDNSLCPLAAILLRCIGQCLGVKRGGEPSTEEDLETVRFCVFGAPGLHRARTEASTQLRNPGSIKGIVCSSLQLKTTTDVAWHPIVLSARLLEEPGPGCTPTVFKADCKSRGI
jgi:hypothetical protein